MVRYKVYILIFLSAFLMGILLLFINPGWTKFVLDELSSSYDFDWHIKQPPGIEDNGDYQPDIQLQISQHSKDSLDNNLKKNGSDYITGFIKFKGEDTVQKVELRYRNKRLWNDSLMHKSWGVTASKKERVGAYRQINLVRLKSKYLLNSHLGYLLAEKMGLFAPKSEILYMSMNSRRDGLRLFVPQIDESLLREQDLMPTDIYVGKIVSAEDMLKGDFSHNETFLSLKFWRKASCNNHYPCDSKAPLEALLNFKDNALIKMVDVKQFAVLAVYLDAIDAVHTHNWVLYYDAYREKFLPLILDPVAWWISIDPSNKQYTEASGILMAELHKSEYFLIEKEKVLKQFRMAVYDDFIVSMDREIEKLLKKISINTGYYDNNSRWVAYQDAKAEVEYFRKAVLKRLDFVYEKSETELKAIRDTETEEGKKLSQAASSATDKTLTPGEGAFIKQQEIATEKVWQGNVYIEQNMDIDYPVTIKAGTRVFLSEKVVIKFNNKLFVKGEKANPVTFSRRTENKAWGSLVLMNGSSGSIIEHAVIQGGSGAKGELFEYTAMVSVHDVRNVTFKNVIFKNSSITDDMIHLVYSDVLFQQCLFKDSYLDALDADISSIEIVNSEFISSGDDALDLMTTSAYVVDTTFIGSLDKGISIGENSRLLTKGLTFTSNDIAAQAKDNSSALLLNTSVKGNRIDFDAYSKNWRYAAGGSFFIVNSDQVAAEYRVDIREKSNLYSNSPIVNVGNSNEQVHYSIDEGVILNKAREPLENLMEKHGIGN
jgi:hypothetical protein